MGIEYIGGKLPFAAHLNDDDLAEELDNMFCEEEEKYKAQHGNTKGFEKTLYPFKFGWNVKFEGQNFDDILTSSVFVKDAKSVAFGDLDLVNGSEGVLVSEVKSDLEDFLSDFSLTLEILKDQKVTQVG